MKIMIKVLGYEYSVYGGEDGHYCGTACTPDKVIELQDINSRYDTRVKVAIYENSINLLDSKATWGYEDVWGLYTEDPYRRSSNIQVPNIQYNVVRAILGISKIGDDFDRYFEKARQLEFHELTLKEFKDIVRDL